MPAKVHQKLAAWLCGGSLGIISVAGMLPEDADGRQTGVCGGSADLFDWLGHYRYCFYRHDHFDCFYSGHGVRVV